MIGALSFLLSNWSLILPAVAIMAALVFVPGAVVFLRAYWREAVIAVLVLQLVGARLDVAGARTALSDHLAADGTARADAEKNARKTEATAATAQAAIETDFLKEARDATASADRTIADLRTGALQLRPELTCRAASGVSGVTAGTGKRDAAGTGGFSERDAERLIRLAGRADAVTMQLRACQLVVEADRRACGEQPAKP